MIEGILKGLMLWLYGLFIDLITYCANALLGVMNTDLSFFEQSVPVVPTLYKIFVAIGWGLLIGNCAFQAMKAMFAGLGFETDSPAVLLIRTFLYGTLLVFSKSICEIGLSIGKNIIDLLEIPSEIELSMPDDSFFSGDASWLLVIIIGFILGFQLIKLFFEIGERYVLVGVLTLLCPVGLAMGGSKATKDICAGYIRTFASMIVLTVTNVLFLKLILSALSNMPSGVMVLPWCLLVVGLAKVARKADNLLSRIGMNPSSTGDPLGSGRGLMVTAMAARTIMSAAGKGKGGKAQRGNVSSGRNNPNMSGAQPTAARQSSDTAYSAKTSYNAGNVSSQNSNSSSASGGSATVNTSSSSRFGASSVNIDPSRSSAAGRGMTGGGKGVNTDRFGIQKQTAVKSAGIGKSGKSPDTKPAPKIQKGNRNNKNRPDNMRKNRFGSDSVGIRHNANPMKPGAAKVPNTGRSAEPIRFGSKDADIPADTGDIKEEDDG